MMLSHFQRSENIVLDNGQYATIMTNQVLNEHMEAALKQKHFLFIGCGLKGGLNDIHMKYFFDKLSKLVVSKQHYCIHPLIDNMNHPVLEVLQCSHPDLENYLQRLFEPENEEKEGYIKMWALVLLI